MAVTNYTPLLGLALPTTGDLSGTWGDVANIQITDLLDDAVAGTTTLSTDASVTLTTTQGGDNQARQAIINCTGARTALRTITAPAQSKAYIVINNTTGGFGVKIVGAGPTTGVTINNGRAALVAWNGSDFDIVATNDIAAIEGLGTNVATALAVNVGTAGAVVVNGGALGTPSSGTLTNATGLPIDGGTTGTLPVARGGTGATTLTANNVLLGNGTSALQVVAPGTNGNVLTSNGTTWVSSAPSSSGGTVTSVSGTGTVNGITLSGTVTTSGSLTLGGALSGVSLTTQVSGTLPVANGGSGATTLTGVLKGNGTSAFSAATAGTDFVAPGTATTFTAKQTFSGSTSVAAATLTNALEKNTVSATAATGTINYDVTTQSVLYYTSNAAANWTVNFRGSSGTSLNTLMATGESITVAFLVTQGSTAYYNSAVQVDGNSVTPKYQGGTAWSSGNASSIDSYVYTIIKTGAATFTVLASQTKFA